MLQIYDNFDHFSCDYDNLKSKWAYFWQLIAEKTIE